MKLCELGGSIEKRIYETRCRFRQEMFKALACKTKKQKIALAARWKREYSAIGYEELIACARNKDACVRITKWELHEV